MSRPQLLSIAAVAAVLMIAAAATVTSCLRRQTADAPDALSTRVYSQVTNGQADTIGQLGDLQYNRGGRSHRLVIPFSQQGRDSLAVYYHRRAGAEFPFEPILVFLLRQQSPEVELIRAVRTAHRSNVGAIAGNIYGNADELLGDGSPVELLTSVHTYPSAGGTLRTRYSVLNENGDESFHLGGKQYPLADGRVFLIDLATDPVRVLQVDDDPAALLSSNYPTKQDLRTFRSKLDARHPAARDFWTR